VFGNDRDQLRLQYYRAWQQHQNNQPLDPLQRQIVAVLLDHPEYQTMFENEQALGSEYAPELGQTNPFMHMGFHLAIRDQVQTDRPAGIRIAYESLLALFKGNAHEVEHRMLDCLAECLWQAQRANQPPDDSAYLECVKELTAR
jgi:hypothetical protein